MEKWENMNIFWLQKQYLIWNYAYGHIKKVITSKKGLIAPDKEEYIKVSS